MKSSWEGRVLAVDPISRGFGFVVLEAGVRLVDWGVRQTRTDKEQMTLGKIRVLAGLYRPEAIVVEDCVHPSSRRRHRIHTLVAAINELGQELMVGVHAIPRALVEDTFGRSGVRTKHAIASTLATRFPDLAPRLPPVRKPWMTEDERFAIFDAMALAVTFVERVHDLSPCAPGTPTAGSS